MIFFDISKFIAVYYKTDLALKNMILLVLVVYCFDQILWYSCLSWNFFFHTENLCPCPILSKNVILCLSIDIRCRYYVGLLVPNLIYSEHFMSTCCCQRILTLPCPTHQKEKNTVSPHLSQPHLSENFTAQTDFLKSRTYKLLLIYPKNLFSENLFTENLFTVWNQNLQQNFLGGCFPGYVCLSSSTCT